MSTIAPILLTMLIGLQPFHADKEQPEARRTRLAMVASSIEKAVDRATCKGDFALDTCIPIFKGQPEELAVGLFTLGKFETHYSRHVHEGRCKPWECDHGKAVGVFQVHKNKIVPIEEWKASVGTSQEANDASAWAAAKTWILSLGCGTIDRAFAGYMTSHCSALVSGAMLRANDYRSNLRWFKKLEKGQK